MGILTYLKVGTVVALIITAGLLVWKYQGMKIQLQNGITRREVAEANLQVAEKTIKILKEYEDVEHIIENAPDDDVVDYLRTGVWPERGAKTGDRPASVPGPAQTGKPPKE